MAAIKDAWRTALRHQKWNFKLDTARFTNVRGIGKTEIIFSHRLLAICGENGVGKTTVLKSLFCGLVPKTAALVGIRLRPQDNSLEAQVMCEITAKIKDPDDGHKVKPISLSKADEISAYLQDGTDEAMVNYVDAAALAQRLVHLIGNDSEFSSVLEGFPEAGDSPDLLSLRREITGRAYSKFTTIEVEEYSSLPVFPYFRATVGNSTYASEEMGLGELCANYLVWALNRLKTGSLLLLEEPESHLPPKAQDRLMAHVATLTAERNLNVIVSTHSQHTLENVPPANLIFLGRLADKILIKTNPAMQVLYHSLRISRAGLYVLIVEDHTAAAFLETLLCTHDPMLKERVDIVFKGGWSGIDEILGSFPRRRPGRVELVGVYDGDQAGALRPDVSWPYVYLPGSEDPAEYMVSAVRADIEGFSTKMNCDLLTLQLAFANLETADIKDFFPALHDALGINIHAMYIAATEIWVADKAKFKESREFIEKVKEALFS